MYCGMIASIKSKYVTVAKAIYVRALHIIAVIETRAVQLCCEVASSNFYASRAPREWRLAA